MSVFDFLSRLYFIEDSPVAVAEGHRGLVMSSLDGVSSLTAALPISGEGSSHDLSADQFVEDFSNVAGGESSSSFPSGRHPAQSPPFQSCEKLSEDNEEKL